jgi:pyruvate dehydrogenase E2 component (dihydrolipoamide acetyltransferase)
MSVDVVLPKVDMDMESGIIAEWKVAEGARVQQGDILFDMETSKSIMEVEAPASGVVRGLAPVNGASLPVGTVVARIETVDGQADATAAPTARSNAQAAPSNGGASNRTERAQVAPTSPQATRSSAPPAAEANVRAVPVDAPAPAPAGGVRATPYARSVARRHGVDLRSVEGSGPKGRVVAQDVSAVAATRAPRADADSRLQPFSLVRRTAARRLAESTRTIPHFYMSAHVDMTALRAELSRVGRHIARAIGTKPTSTVAIACIVARVLVRHPLLNASVEGEAARVHDRVHVGVAMDRDGDLYVPVLRDAHARSLRESTAEFRRLRDAVRSRSIAAADLRGATFTVSSLEMYGVDAYTAIIDPPQSAILAVGRRVDTPVGRDGAVVLRPMAKFCLSSDHRIVDGITAARFMADLRRAIENPEPLEETQ